MNISRALLLDLMKKDVERVNQIEDFQTRCTATQFVLWSAANKFECDRLKKIIFLDRKIKVRKKIQDYKLENGNIIVEVFSRDCDLYETTYTTEIKANWIALECLENSVCENAEGPTYVSVIGSHHEMFSRDRAAEQMNY